MYFVAVIANMVVFISPSLSISEALRHIVFFLLDFEGNTRTEPTHSLKMCFLLGMVSLGLNDI